MGIIKAIFKNIAFINLFFKKRRILKWINFYTNLYYLNLMAGDLNVPNKEKEFSNMDLWLIRILRNMKGTKVGELYTLKALNAFAQRLRYLQIKEAGIFYLGLKYPKLFSFYLTQVLYPYYAQYFNQYQKNSKVILIHNFAGARLTVLCYMVHSLMNNENTAVLADETAFEFMQSWLFRIHGRVIGPQEDVVITPQDMVLPKSSQNANLTGQIVLINANKPENLLKASKLLKQNHYNVVVIPESNGRFKNNIVCPFLNKEFSIPSGVTKLFQFANSILSVIPDTRDSIIMPELIIQQEFISPGNQETDRRKILIQFVKYYESITSLNPYLFVPFDYSYLWPNLYSSVGDEEEKILYTSFNRNECLMLLSNGKMVVFRQKEYKKVIKHLQFV